MLPELELINARIKALETALVQSARRVDMLERGMLDLLQKAVSGISLFEQRYNADYMSRSFAHVSGMFPKTKTVIFVGRSYFGGNIKYAYLAFCKMARQRNIECYFMAGDKAQYEQITAAGLPCLPFEASEWTAENIRTLLGASVVVLADSFIPHGWRSPLPYALLQGAKRVQLWHGIPLKRIGLENIVRAKDNTPGSAEFLAASGRFEMFVGSSAASQGDWTRRFSFDAFAPTGYPCTDVFFRDIADEDRINVDGEALAAVQKAGADKAPVVLYAPTFRQHADATWFEKSQIAMLAAHCRAGNYLFCIALHPAEHALIGDLSKRYPDIRFLAPNTDIYPVMKYASLLITDYSSLAFEYLLLDRPVIFHRPDHADYVARSNALIDDHNDYVMGDVTVNGDQLIRAADTAISGADAHKDARHALTRKLFDHRDGLAAQRLNELITKQILSACGEDAES